MKDFLREYWFYIVAPVALVLIGLLTLVFFGFGGDDSPFIYNIF